MVANSGSYGDFAETNPVDIDPDAEPTPRAVRVYGDKDFTTFVERPERPGRFCFFPTASLVTAGARLLLALGFYEVARRGGETAYCDTDSLIVPASKDGGLVPCDGGPHLLANGQFGIRALSWKEVEAIRTRFERLNPYRTGSGSLLKLEGQNFTDDNETRANLWFYGVSEKVYALFTLDEFRTPVVRKYSAHALGQYRSPIEGDRAREWIEMAWRRKILAAFGRAEGVFAWQEQAALAQLTLSTWSVIKPYLENPNIRPFDFLLVATPTRSVSDFAKGYAVCCADPRPSCFLFDDPVAWESQDWRCLRCGKRFPSRRFRSYASILHGTLDGFEVKRLCANGNEPGEDTMRGLTIPRPVRVEKIVEIGKEVIVDPTDTDEGLTAEVLSATDALEYVSPDDELKALRARVRVAGIRAVSESASLSRRHVQEFASGQTTPRSGTIKKLERALRKLRASRGLCVAIAHTD
ncbi:MAG: hypothetical protein WB615_03730 [Candidatus Tumulicola sp.]